jgi:hypothetical protein
VKLRLLALAPGHRLHREQVMDLPWPEEHLLRRAGASWLQFTLDYPVRIRRLRWRFDAAFGCRKDSHVVILVEPFWRGEESMIGASLRVRKRERALVLPIAS